MSETKGAGSVPRSSIVWQKKTGCGGRLTGKVDLAIYPGLSFLKTSCTLSKEFMFGLQLMRSKWKFVACSYI